jgi:hypothetical protein
MGPLVLIGRTLNLDWTRLKSEIDEFHGVRGANEKLYERFPGGPLYTERARLLNRQQLEPRLYRAAVRTSRDQKAAER